jgi:hypothetical protein
VTAPAAAARRADLADRPESPADRAEGGAGPAAAADPRRVGVRALEWISAHRHGFGLGPDPLAPGTDVNRTWKPLGELAQVCAVVRRRTSRSDPAHGLAADLLAHAWRLTGHGRLFADLARLEPFATYPLEVYAAFAAEGLREPRFEELAAAVARTGGWRTTEQQPNRRLGILNCERRAGLPGHGAAAPALRRTWLGTLPEPWTFERTAGYTLTHVVFHLTDWGLRPGDVPADVAGYLETWLPPWLDTCAEDAQWDLTCELLAVAAALPRPLPPAACADAWTALARAQDGAGCLPELGAARGRPAAPRVFATSYHSTLMAAFAAFLTLGRAGGTA